MNLTTWVNFSKIKCYRHTPLLYLSSYIIKHKEPYYRLLSQARNMENFERWVIYILDGIIETSKQTLEKIRKIGVIFTLFP